MESFAQPFVSPIVLVYEKGYEENKMKKIKILPLPHLICFLGEIYLKKYIVSTPAIILYILLFLPVKNGGGTPGPQESLPSPAPYQVQRVNPAGQSTFALHQVFEKNINVMAITLGRLSRNSCMKWWIYL